MDTFGQDRGAKRWRPVALSGSFGGTGDPEVIRVSDLLADIGANISGRRIASRARSNAWCVLFLTLTHP